MAAVIEDIEVGFEEAMSWLPSHVLDEAILETKKKKDDVKYHYHRYRSKMPAEPFPQASGRRHHKPRYSGNLGSGGPGMQAFFLDSGHKSCGGTGVFLPQRAGTDFEPARRPTCSPVLLPRRVVQALNLNVHEIGLQISPRRDPNNNKYNNNAKRGGEVNPLKNYNSCNKKGNDQVLSAKRCVISKKYENSSPEIFLPKEWTY